MNLSCPSSDFGLMFWSDVYFVVRRILVVAPAGSALSVAESIGGRFCSLFHFVRILFANDQSKQKIGVCRVFVV